MPEPPRRKRFQIHLSTAIVMMFVAGGLIWGSACRNGHVVVFRLDPVAEIETHEIDAYGWPFEAIFDIYDNGTKQPDGHWEYKRQDLQTLYGMLALDILVLLGLLFPIYQFCEGLIRRRAARKGAGQHVRPFQIHLSTAILLMAVAGMLIWANTAERHEPRPLDRFSVTDRIQYGWPCDAAEKFWTRGIDGKPLEVPLEFSHGIGANILIAFEILFAVWYFSERLIRRRAARKGA